MRPWPLLAAAAIGLYAVAAAEEVEVLFQGSEVSDWSTARDPDRLSREFSLSEVVGVKEPPALQWRFVSRGVTFNDLFLMRPVERPFRALRVRLKNEGRPFQFALKVQDRDGAEWTVPPVALPTGDWRELEFPRQQWQVAGWSQDPDGKLDFPLNYVTLIAFGLESGPQTGPGLLTGPEYRLQVARVEAVRPDPPVATVSELRVPARLKAGRQYAAGLTFSLDKPCQEEGSFLVFRRGKAEELRVAISLPKALSAVAPGERIEVASVPLRVPLYAPGGDQRVTLQLGEARVKYQGQSAGQEGIAVTIEARTPGKTVAEVKPHNGTPTLFINGQPRAGMTWATYGPTVEVFSDFTKAGINLYTFAGTPTEAGYGLSRTVWKGPGEYDYSQFDERVRMLLQVNPEAYFFPRLYVHAPKWWSAQHPDDLVLMDPGDGKPVPFIHSGGLPAPSWASEAWRRDTVEGLRRLIAHIEASPYADRVIGYHISSGTTEEWMMWGSNEDQWVDYSPVNVRKFQQWLRDQYHTQAALRAAWADPAVSFETAAIPTKAQRTASRLGALRDPASEQPVIDFYRYNSDLVADTICFFGRAVKDLTRREKIMGVFYGYLLQLCGEQRQQNAGHLALEKVLASPDVDFICSPTSYAFRQLGGEGTSHFMSLFGSVKLHGKLWFDENDIRTSISGGAAGEWGRPASLAGDLLQQDKELANCITNGAAQWWFDVGENKYNDPALMARIALLASRAREALDLDRSPADQVAMVVDERSLCYLRPGEPLGAWLLVSQLPALQRIGAPVGHYLVTDLPRLRDHKLFLLMTSFAPTAADRQAVEALKRDGHVLVFMVAPGLYRDGKLDETGMADLTGIKLRMSREPAPLQVTLRAGHRLTEGLAGTRIGPDPPTWPVCTADDPQATVLGALADGRPGLVVRDFGSWTAVFSAAPLLPTPLLQRLADLAGVHRYIDTEDVVWAVRDFVAVCVNRAGEREIRLPREAAVTDLYTGRQLSPRARSFRAQFDERATRVFVLR